MRSLFFHFVLSIGLTAVSVAQQTVVVTSSGSAGGPGLYADGSAWPVNGDFSFDVGVFPAGFDPATADRAALIPSWLSIRQSGIPGAVTSWFRDGASTYFSLIGSAANLRPTDLPGTQYYLWGYNSRAISTAAEWVLITNPAWRATLSDVPQLQFFDTRDAGTVAIIGQLGSGGMNLKSERVFASSLQILAQATNVAVAAGQTATLTVTARGTDLIYQWYAGDKGDVARPVAGATRSTYTVGAVAAAARYWVRISNTVQTADSETMTVAVSGDGAGVVVVYDPMNLGYFAGQRVRVKQQIAYTGTPSSVSLSALVPAGWSYLASEGAEAQVKPLVATTDLLEWSWTTLPPSPFTLTYILGVLPGMTGDQTVTTLVTAVRAGQAYQSLVLPDPLAVRPGVRFHSADIDHNNRIDLAELTRIIEIYNTRAGTQRTGAYRVDGASEDGFAPDAVRTLADAVALGVYHTADVAPRDGRISLTELTRVIELFNCRSGTVRTGAYFARGDTEDGFVSGVAP